MAKFIVVAVRDAAVNAFNTPMFFRSGEEARRSFGDAVRDPKNVDFSNHAMDFSLYHVGTWDDAGELTGLSEPQLLMKASECFPAS